DSPSLSYVSAGSQRRKLIGLLFGLSLICITLLALLIWRTLTCSSSPVPNVLISPDASKPQDRCPLDWIPGGQTCYYISQEKKSQNESEKSCKSVGSRLAVVKEPNSILRTIITRTSEEYWVGLYKSHAEWDEELRLYKWRGKWADGTSEVILGDEGSCAKMGKGLKMGNCFTPLRWICEKEPSPSISPTGI
uniref:C-type lectin domain-containing protein n=1 Tax=Xenopus tropicalis TaxID=8364 RepID=A0A803KE02_XENTR